MDEVLKDKRFAHIARDPRYRKIPRAERKVKIDTRFKSMFEDKRFKLKYSVDKRGRPINLTTNENLRKFYELSDEDTSEDEDGPEGTASTSDDTDSDSIKEVDREIVHGTEDGHRLKTKQKASEAEQSKIVSRQKTKATIKHSAKDSLREVIGSGDDDSASDEGGADSARGDGNVESSSSDDDDDDGDEAEDDEFDHKWGEVDSNAVDVTEAAPRLAVCNMDWDRVKAKDIFAMLNSFKPANGIITSVKVYPSEYGQARLAEEQSQGPRELIEGGGGGGDSNVEDNEGTRYHTEKLRKYQLNRLKYYYAVVECDCAVTAAAIYDDCDGMEYETSSTKLDLRYIPDEMEFDQEATSTCTEMPHGYKPVLFANTALSQSKVDLTWDETDQERVRSTAQVWAARGSDDEAEDDLRAYLASSSDDEAADYGAMQEGSDSDSEGGVVDEERQISRYRSLLQGLDARGGDAGKPRDVEMEITWEPGLKETTEGIIKKKKNSKELTPWEEYLQKKKEKKKKKREERKKKHDSDDDVPEPESEPVDGDAAFSDDELPTGVDLDDPFFSQEMKTRDNKKTDKKKKKKKDRKKDVQEENTQEQAELSLLVMDEEEDKRHFNLEDLIDDTRDGKSKKKKKKKKKQTDGDDKKDADNFQVDVADPRFAAMFDSHHYNIDPSAPEYKKTKGTEAIISEKLKRRREKGKKHKDNSSSVVDKKRRTEAGGGTPTDVKDNSLALLVKSVKVKTQQFQGNKKR